MGEMNGLSEVAVLYGFPEWIRFLAARYTCSKNCWRRLQRNRKIYYYIIYNITENMCYFDAGSDLFTQQCMGRASSYSGSRDAAGEQQHYADLHQKMRLVRSLIKIECRTLGGIRK